MLLTSFLKEDENRANYALDMEVLWEYSTLYTLNRTLNLDHVIITMVRTGTF